MSPIVPGLRATHWQGQPACPVVWEGTGQPRPLPDSSTAKIGNARTALWSGPGPNGWHPAFQGTELPRAEQAGHRAGADLGTYRA